jgi:DNA gyrase subunit A
MDVVIPDGQLLIISALGHAKRTPLAQFPTHNRGVGGVIAQKISDKSGPIVTARVVLGTEEAMVLSTAGTILRTLVSTISVQGRAAQGVALMSLKAGEQVACVAILNGHDNGPDPAEDAPRRRGRNAGTEEDPSGPEASEGGEDTPPGSAPRRRRRATSEE